MREIRRGAWTALWFGLALLGNALAGRLIWSAERAWASGGVRFRVRRGILMVPASYDDVRGEHMTVYIERFRPPTRATTTRPKGRHHMILLSGGPGQSGALWRHELPPLLGRIPTPLQAGLLFYTVDVRGVGKSSRLYDVHDREWRRFFDPPHDPARYSVSNAARDIALLGRLVQKDPDDKLSLLGVSFGGFLAARTVAMHPTLFDWLLMDSPSMTAGRFSAANDEGFWKNCRDDRHCRRMIGSVPAIRRAYHRVATGRRRNPCVRMIERRGGIDDWLWPLLRGEVSDAGRPTLHPSMLAVPLILHLYRCPCELYFGRVIVPHVNRIRDQGRIAVAERKDGEDEAFAINQFYNSYILISELMKYPEQPDDCAGASHTATLTNQCNIWQRYYPDYLALQDHRYVPDQWRDNPVNSGRTRVVVLAGGMDLVTPSRLAMRWLRTVRARQKILLHWNTRGHVVTPDASCLSHLFAAVFAPEARERKGHLRRLARCMERTQKTIRLDWRFGGEEYAFAQDWCALLDSS